MPDLNYFAIVIDLPAQDEAGKVINDDNGQPVYELNYFCGLNKTEIPGVVLNEWDTDIKFVKRFAHETVAENFRRVVLESLEGSRVQELKPPPPINGKLLKRLTLIAVLFISITFASCAARPVNGTNKKDGCERYHKPFKKFKA